MDIPKTPGRKPRKQNEIADYLRKRIINGVWKKGEKIPPRAELEKMFNVSSVTIQRTLTPLVEDGFLRVVPNRGTYVNEELPNVLNYALVLPETTEKDSQNLFFRTLRSEALKLQDELDIKIIPYDDVISPVMNYNTIQLIKDIRAQRLAGIIFSTSVHFLKKSPTLLEKDIPRVVICQNSNQFPNIYFDSKSFVDLSLDYMLEKGRRKVSLISSSFQYGPFTDYFHQAVAKRNMIFKDYWHQLCHINSPKSAEQVISLMMSEANTDKPDGIIVSDDNLITAVCQGLKKTPTRVPEDCEVVSLSNFPRSIKVDYPIEFIGNDCREVIKKSLQVLKEQQKELNPDTCLFIKASHEKDAL